MSVSSVTHSRCCLTIRVIQFRLCRFHNFLAEVAPCGSHISKQHILGENLSYLYLGSETDEVEEPAI